MHQGIQIWFVKIFYMLTKQKRKRKESTFMFASWRRQQAVVNNLNTKGEKKNKGLTTIGTGRTGSRDSLLMVHLPLKMHKQS